MADARPVFDFKGAIQAALRLANFAVSYRDGLAPRFEARNASLAEWRGVHADSFSQRADDENQSAINVLLGLRQESANWLTAWTMAVSIMNNVLYAEAVEAQERYIQKKIDDRNILGDVWGGVDHFFTGSDTAFDGVPSPKEIERPRLTGEETHTVAYDLPFASYQRDGDSFTVTYVSDVPAAPHE